MTKKKPYCWYRPEYKKSGRSFLVAAAIMTVAIVALAVISLLRLWDTGILFWLSFIIIQCCYVACVSIAMTFRHIDEHERKLSEGK